MAALLVSQGVGFHRWLASLATPPEPFDRADAIVTLAGGPVRLERGLDLLAAGKADVLLLSGVGPTVSLKQIFPERDLSALRPGQVILLESRSTSTYENAIEAWAVLSARTWKGSGESDSRPLREVVLLTANYHMLRARYVFRRVFPPEVTLRLYPVQVENVEPGLWWRDSHARRVVLTEYLKYVWYRMRY